MQLVKERKVVMSAIVVGPEEIAVLKKLVEVAESNIVSYEELRISISVTLTVEAQGPGLFARHMSMVGSRPGRVPRPEAVEMVLPHLGFVRTLADCLNHAMPTDKGTIAIHIWQPDEKLSTRDALDKIGWKRLS